MNYPRGIEVGVVSIIINDQMNKILLCHSMENRGWTFAGGHVEPGESLEETVVREIGEELEIEIDLITQLEMLELIYSKDNINGRHIIIYPFVAKIKAGQIIKTDGIEIDSTEWFDIDTAEKELNKHYAKAIPFLKKWIQEKK